MAIPLIGAIGTKLGVGAASGVGAGAAGAGAGAAGGAAGGAGIWGQFSSMFKGPQGGENAAGMMGGLLSPGPSKISTLAQLMRGPTMPFLPHLNTSQVGPNSNPGLVGLASLLQQIASRRG